MLTQILFNDEQTIHLKTLIIPEDTTFNEVYEKATKYAKADKYECMSHNIPDKYWIKAGAYLPTEPIITIEADSVGVYRKISDIDYISCRTCDHFDSGCCLKYGGHCDPDEIVEDCYINNDKPPFALRYNDEILKLFTYQENLADISEAQSNINSIIQHFVDEYNTDNNTAFSTLEWLNAALKDSNLNNPPAPVTEKDYDPSLFTISQ